MLYRHKILILYYLVVQEAMVSARRPVHSNMTQSYSLTWPTECYTPRRTAFKALLNAKGALFKGLLKPFLRSWKTARKDSWSMCTYCTKTGSCVGSDIKLGSWSVSIHIQGLTVVYRQTECRRCHKYGFCMATDIGYFIKMAQIKTMHDKPAYVQI